MGLFNPYFDTMGGGERYFLTAASYYLNRGDTVDIFWHNPAIKSEIKERFNIDIDKANFVSKFKTFGYDLIFFVSDGSIPFSFAKKTIIHFQTPFTYNNINLLTKIKLFRTSIICNSEFTKSFVDKSYGVNSTVVYPPVDIDAFNSGKKENIILTVGRFFGPSHPKKQEVLIKEFIKMKLKNWKLVLIGGVFPGSENEVEKLAKLSKGYPIKIIPNSNFETLKEYYGKAKIYWHATGFGEDLAKYPEKAEHFGISTVEAMAAGCVPVCFSGGGQVEIIDNNINGFLWKTVKELTEITLKIIGDDKLRQKIANNAMQKSGDYNLKKFYAGLEAVSK
mgnify:CR=1 FL=1